MGNDWVGKDKKHLGLIVDQKVIISQQCGGNYCIEEAGIILDINKYGMQELRIRVCTGQTLLKYEVHKRYKKVGES